MPEDTLINLLELVDRKVTLDQIRAWTPGQRYHAELWAENEWDSANDNPDVDRIPTPPHVAVLPPAKVWD
jgi:hypothetical protein